MLHPIVQELLLRYQKRLISWCGISGWTICRRRANKWRKERRSFWGLNVLTWSFVSITCLASKEELCSKELEIFKSNNGSSWYTLMCGVLPSSFSWQLFAPCGFHWWCNSHPLYFVTFIDDATHMLWKHKSDVFDVFKKWKGSTENESGCKLKRLTFDNSGASPMCLMYSRNGKVEQRMNRDANWSVLHLIIVVNIAMRSLIAIVRERDPKVTRFQHTQQNDIIEHMNQNLPNRSRNLRL